MDLSRRSAISTLLLGPPAFAFVPSTPNVATTAPPPLSDLLQGHLNNVGTKTRFLALRSGSTIIDGADPAYNPSQLTAGQQGKLTLQPEYFNAPENMFGADNAGHVRYKRRGTVVFSLQQTTGTADVAALGWQHTSYIIDFNAHSSDRPNGDYEVRSTPLGGASVTTLSNLPVYDATMNFTAQLSFLLDAQPRWEQLIKTVLSDATVLESAAAGFSFIAIPAATVPAFSVITQALQIFDSLTAGSEDRIERLIEHNNGTPTQMVLGPSSSAAGGPGAVKIPLGIQEWVLLPDALADQFLTECTGHAFLYDGSRIKSQTHNATLDAIVAKYPYTVVTTKLVAGPAAAAATVAPARAPAIPTNSPTPSPQPSASH